MARNDEDKIYSNSIGDTIDGIVKQLDQRKRGSSAEDRAGLDREIRKKIALFGSVPEDAVISARDVDNVYKVPLVLRAEGMDDLILDHFDIGTEPPDLSD